MKLSIIILCWNDLKVISESLASIYATTRLSEFEVVVSDNGSTDGSIEMIRRDFPQVRVIENKQNLRFAKGNNIAIGASRGEYVLILNPDTIIHDQTLDQLIAFADKHPEAGAFGCRVLNRDGTDQRCSRPLPTIRSEWFRALGLAWLGQIFEWAHAGEYANWKGDVERPVGWLAGCCILVRGNLLKRIGGFDERFFYYFEDTDLCHRIWNEGCQIIYNPSWSITHLGGQSTKTRFPALGFVLDGEVTRYLYFYKYYGEAGARHCRWTRMIGLLLRRSGYGTIQLIAPNKFRGQRLELLRAVFEWNCRVNPIRLVQLGEEPKLSVNVAKRVLER